MKKNDNKKVRLSLLTQAKYKNCHQTKLGNTPIYSTRVGVRKRGNRKEAHRVSVFGAVRDGGGLPDHSLEERRPRQLHPPQALVVCLRIHREARGVGTGRGRGRGASQVLDALAVRILTTRPSSGTQNRCSL